MTTSTPINMDFPPNRTLAAAMRLSGCYELAFAAVFALLFNGVLTVFYEMFLHNAASYTHGRSFLVMCIGWFTFVLFAVGLLLSVTQLYSR
jgi:hypothetical protein